ncbi:2,3-diketo-5-methylthio-1-phosphopentane phosphatase [Izhakiella australiensis]|uniref:Enolase-phosphatase E1 n=1 Tax=Izhakiella australiensis TaxID=1926881 RepID=A0A1S8YCB2_9GAMM|nr:acireductone synthase [Izhakiella australiensis]OON36452.1 2,3-diketo-5-methylthio-1-phosphopentane phosphatase [Izhakiella australiensis]
MIRAIVTDIEGTTSDIRFVHQVLFPYARKHLESWLAQHQHEDAVVQSLNDLRQETDQPQATQAELVAVLYQFMDEDRKSTALKALQGMIWRDGYLNGDFTGHLYADVLPALQAWQQQGIKLCVYSSGSVAAQKLLFGYSDAGDLTGLFSGWFDTHVGAKRDVTSYRNIQQQLGLAPQELLFLSDINQELDAARSAGWHTLQLIRDRLDTDSSHRQVASFAEINPEFLPT